MSAVTHVRGPILTGPQEVADELWVIGGRISFSAPATGEVTDVAGWVLPGLVDAHCHVGLDSHGAVDDETTRRQALDERSAGALLLRDAGSAADTRWLDTADDLPRVIRAGRHIARTKRYIRNYAHEIEPEDLTAYVVAEARRGDGWVKLVGDWIDRERGDLAPCWPADALRPAIAAAHREGARVTAHCFGEECLTDLVTAGIDCIEHGTGLTGETVELLAGHGVPIVPTLINIANFPDIAARARDKFPTYADHLLALHARRHATVRDAFDAGIAVFTGTDAGGSLPHGLIAREVAELVEAGLPTDAALAATTWSARRWLGRPALTEGAPADLVIYPTDPRADVGVLAHPDLVMLAGRVYA